MIFEEQPRLLCPGGKERELSTQTLAAPADNTGLEGKAGALGPRGQHGVSCRLVQTWR